MVNEAKLHIFNYLKLIYKNDSITKTKVRVYQIAVFKNMIQILKEDRK